MKKLNNLFNTEKKKTNKGESSKINNLTQGPFRSQNILIIH